MVIVFFKAKIIDIYVLISYCKSVENKNVILNEIRFFPKEAEILAYIEKNQLNNIEENNEPASIKNLKTLINEYLSGKNINLFKKIKSLNIDLLLDDKFPTFFSKEVINYLINNVNFGKFTTYSQIGEGIGSKAYRAIGNVLKKNPLPIIIPCHRVIRKNGHIGGFMGKTNNEWEQLLKKKLLEIEGK
jgi:methylated-DNA-[protein]-cysteine S-methyltransferase